MAGLWTFDIADPSVRSRGRQISLMKKPMSCGTVSCLKISMASVMRLVCYDRCDELGCLPVDLVVLDVGVLDNG